MGSDKIFDFRFCIGVNVNVIKVTCVRQSCPT